MQFTDQDLRAAVTAGALDAELDEELDARDRGDELVSFDGIAISGRSRLDEAIQRMDARAASDLLDATGNAVVAASPHARRHAFAALHHRAPADPLLR